MDLKTIESLSALFIAVTPIVYLICLIMPGFQYYQDKRTKSIDYNTPANLQVKNRRTLLDSICIPIFIICIILAIYTRLMKNKKSIISKE